MSCRLARAFSHRPEIPPFVIQALFVLDPPGRSLGVDALLRGRRGRELGIPTSVLS
jgi:hypothetical protein